MEQVYFLFSSITFLQLYIPLVIEHARRGHKSVFIIRKNQKPYACPIIHDTLLNAYAKTYNINLKPFSKYLCTCKKKRIFCKHSLSGIVYMVDGDIYGPSQSNVQESMLFHIDMSNATTISLTENMNYMWTYSHCIEHVDYYNFISSHYVDTYGFISTKNIYLGSTKYDNIPGATATYKKYGLSETDKHMLILHPKHKYADNYNHQHLHELCRVLKSLGYYVIVKSRPKSNTFLTGDKNVSSDIYPNETLELLQACKLCIFFSSSAIDECIFTGTPSINFDIDPKAVQRLTFLKIPSLHTAVNGFPKVTRKQLKSMIGAMLPKHDPRYSQAANKYMSLGDTAPRLADLSETIFNLKYGTKTQIIS